MTPILREVGSGPVPLVLLHGWGAGTAAWDAALPGLAARFTVYRVTLPGHGEAPPWPAAAGIAELAEAVAARVPADAIWAGWSLGGLAALAAAAHHRVAGLCLVAASPRFVAGPGWPGGVAPAVFAAFEALLRQDPAGARRRFAALLAGPDEPPRETAALLAAEPAWEDPARRLAAPLALLGATDLRPALAAVRCPVEWLLASGDRLVPAELAAALPRRPGWSIRRCAGGHAFFARRPGPVTAALHRLADRGR